MTKPCEKCGGTGYFQNDTCGECEGLGFVPSPPPRLETVATSDRKIVGIVVFQDRLFVATDKAVYQRRADGHFYEVVFVSLPKET